VWQDLVVGGTAGSGSDGAVIPDPHAAGAWLVRVGGIDQSWVDPAHPERLEFDYMLRIGQHIDAHAPAGERLRVVHVGGAGMSLARYVAATRPTSAQIVLEPDAALTAEVRAKAPLPKRSGIKVRATDGRAGVAALPDDYADIVVLDAFADGQVPADLVSADFFRDVSRALTDTGLFVANLVDDRPFDWARRVMAGVVAVFPHCCLGAEPAVFKGRRFGNLVAAGARAPLPDARLDRAAAASPFPYKTLRGPELARFLGGAAPFADSDAQPSPPRAFWPTWYG
jgi:spermidine synthase